MANKNKIIIEFRIELKTKKVKDTEVQQIKINHNRK